MAYFNEKYFHQNYWHEDYWYEAPATEPPEQDYFHLNYFHGNYFHDNYWAIYTESAGAYRGRRQYAHRKFIEDDREVMEIIAVIHNFLN